MSRQLKATRGRRQEMTLTCDGEELRAHLTMPDNARSIILFVGCGGSSCDSAMSEYAAEYLNKRGHASLVLDHLTPGEQADDCGTIKTYGFYSDVFTHRLVEASSWIKLNDELKHLNLGYFCEPGTEVASLAASASLHEDVKAVVATSVSAEMADVALDQISSPVLFLLPADEIDAVQSAIEITSLLSFPCDVDVIDYHLGAETAKESISELAGDWFDWYLLDSGDKTN